jgi:hypothetical protein
MAARQCFHCKSWIEDGEPHDCWTTTEGALTRDLSEDLQDAYARLKEAAVEFGEQRIYASHHSIMFARKAAYFFVRPKAKFLEVVFFVGRPIQSPKIKKVLKTTRIKFAHIIRVVHRDEVEPPVTDWLREAYGLQDTQKAEGKRQKAERSGPPAKRPLRKAKLKKR